MKKITREAINAFYTPRTDFNKSNTIVEGDLEESKLYLFGNLIAIYNHYRHETHISNAGWQSVTTKERLNGLTGVSIVQRKGDWYLNGELWDGSWVTVENN